MRKLLILVLLLSNSLLANDLNEIRDVLKHVETNWNPDKTGDGGDSFGILQIQNSVILDVNRRFGTSYEHGDAFDEACAEEIFQLYISMWSKNLEKKEKRPTTEEDIVRMWNGEEDIVRMWNGGPNGYKRRSTLDYLGKYNEYKEVLVMNRQNCMVNCKKGVILKRYTHTYDVFMFKTKKTMFGVSRNVVKLLPKQETLKEIRAKAQYSLPL
jgi:hypothetical protein